MKKTGMSAALLGATAMPVLAEPVKITLRGVATSAISPETTGSAALPGRAAPGGGRLVTDTGAGAQVAGDVMARVEKLGKVAPVVEGCIKLPGP